MSKIEKPRRLGRGLSSLIGEPVRFDVAPATPTLDTQHTAGVQRIANGDASRELPKESPSTSGVAPEAGRSALRMIPLDEIVASRFQPRQEFDEAGLKALAASIAAAGVMQPIAVRPIAHESNTPSGVRWELVAGERRWRAARLVGLAVVPAVVTALSDREAAEWSLVENLQRADLNYMERAWAFRKLSERFALSHAQIAERVGIDRSSVANLIRLTELEESIRRQIGEGRLSPGHGKALLALAPGAARVEIAERAERGQWSVRRLEELAKEGASAPESGGATGAAADARGPDRREAARQDLERRIGERLGTRVRIRTAAGGKRGNLMIEFFDLDHFEALLAKLGIAVD